MLFMLLFNHRDLSLLLPIFGFVGLLRGISMVNWQMFGIFMVVLTIVTILALFAGRWRRGDLSRLHEWGLAGRRFGTTMSWFLIGGNLYTAYTFIAIPGTIFALGAQGFFAIPYAILAYIIFFLVLPRFWTVARHRGYVTPADFVRERFDSGILALLIALTGLLATMPYIALQMYGIQIVIAQMGVPLNIVVFGVKIDIALIIAFVIMALYTYNSGLRGPAIMAMVKDIFIWIVVLVAIVYIPQRLGGFAHIFALVPQQKVILSPKQYLAFSSLALGSAMALLLYPHALTSVFSTNSRKAIQRNAILLPIYSILLGLIGLLGYVAVAAGIKPSPIYKTSSTLPALFSTMFPGWFAGFSFATIVIGALVPAAIMSIAAANLFTRNIYKEYFRPSCTEREESMVAKLTSLSVKFGAVLFILLVPTTDIINFQLLGGVWILQTLPAVFLGLYTNWFHPKALIIGWASGMLLGTLMAASQNFASIYPLTIAGYTLPIYAGLASVVVNLFLTVTLTLLFRLFNFSTGQDATSKADYEASPVLALSPLATPLQPPMPVPPTQPVFQNVDQARQFRDTPLPSFNPSSNRPSPLPISGTPSSPYYSNQQQRPRFRDE